MTRLGGLLKCVFDVCFVWYNLTIMEEMNFKNKIDGRNEVERDIKPAHKIDDPSELSRHGKYFYSRQQWKLALPYLERIFQDFSTQGLKHELFTNIARCFLNLKEYDPAIEYLKEGMKRFENIKEHYVLYAEALRLKGYFHESKQLFEELKQKYPDDIDIQERYYIVLVNYYIRKNDIAKAIECFEQYKFLVGEGSSQYIADIEIKGWKLIQDILSAVKTAMSFKALEKKLSTIVSVADDLDKMRRDAVGELSMYRPLIESIIASLKGQAIDKSFCGNLAAQFKENHFHDEAIFAEKIIHFNDFVRDLFENHSGNIPADLQKKSLGILRTKTYSNFSGADGEKKEILEKEKNFIFWTSDGKNTGTVTENEVSGYRQRSFLFVDDDNHLVYKKGKQVKGIDGLQYKLLSVLLKQGGQVVLSRLPNILYGNEARDYVRQTESKRQSNAIAGIKLRLTRILEKEEIASVQAEGGRNDDRKYCLYALAGKEKNFGWVLVRKADSL